MGALGQPFEDPVATPGCPLPRLYRTGGRVRHGTRGGERFGYGRAPVNFDRVTHRPLGRRKVLGAVGVALCPGVPAASSSASRLPLGFTVILRYVSGLGPFSVDRGC